MVPGMVLLAPFPYRQPVSTPPRSHITIFLFVESRIVVLRKKKLKMHMLPNTDATHLPSALTQSLGPTWAEWAVVQAERSILVERRWGQGSSDKRTGRGTKVVSSIKPRMGSMSFS